MSSQTTIFMALEEPKQILKQRVQSAGQCEYCDKPLLKNGFYYLFKKKYTIYYFDSQPCRAKFKDKLREMYPEEFIKKNPKKKTVIVKCTYCDKEFEVFQSKYNEAKKRYNGHLYCSRECSRNNQHTFYNDFYYCDFCTGWIRKNEAVWIKTEKREYPTCHKPSCSNNKLKTRSTNYKPKNKKNVNDSNTIAIS